MSERDELEHDWVEANARGSASLVVVWGDYEINNGVITQGSEYEEQRLYFPIAKPGLASEIAKLRPGDNKAALAYVRKWGTLGYSEIQSASGVMTIPHGDPLVWMWAHAQGIRTVLTLHRLLQQGDGAALQAYIEELRVTIQMLVAESEAGSRMDKGHVGEALDFVDALFTVRQEDDLTQGAGLVYGHRQRIVTTKWLGWEDGKVEAAARRIITGIINPNIVGVYRQVAHDKDAGSLKVRRGWDCPLSVAYWHLGELVAGGRVEECENCNSLFVQTRRFQRFCPAPPFTSESSCASAFRQRKRRAKGA